MRWARVSRPAPRRTYCVTPFVCGAPKLVFDVPAPRDEEGAERNRKGPRLAIGIGMGRTAKLVRVGRAKDTNGNRIVEDQGRRVVELMRSATQGHTKRGAGWPGDVHPALSVSTRSRNYARKPSSQPVPSPLSPADEPLQHLRYTHLSETASLLHVAAAVQLSAVRAFVSVDRGREPACLLPKERRAPLSRDEHYGGVWSDTCDRRAVSDLSEECGSGHATSSVPGTI